MNRPVLIAMAWPYANGPLHLGHVCGLIASDVLARYFRLRGDKVLFVSGSDCHGTPILNRALQEKKTPAEIAEFYHRQFTENFLRLGFTHDLYAKTLDPFHYQIAQQFFQKLYEKGLLIPKNVPQLYCQNCQRFLVDRYVEGVCPNCKAANARGDQCDVCGHTYEATALIEPRCKNCGQSATIAAAEHLYFNLPALKTALNSWTKTVYHNWRPNAQSTTLSWLEQGLEPRAVTRDIDWGIPVPVKNFTGKKIYVWFEAVLGYFSTSIKHLGGTIEKGPWESWWRPENNPLHYYVHGKDNIPFHTIIFPAMLLGFGDLALPTHIISSEYLQLPGGQKFSTSEGYGTTLNQYLELTDKTPGLTTDTLRFFLIGHNPELKDAQFSWDELTNQHNAELVNKLGNLLSRVLSLLNQHFNNRVPLVNGLESGDESLLNDIKQTYADVGSALEAGGLRKATAAWLDLIDKANIYLNQRAPWQQIKTDQQQAGKTLYITLQVLANLASITEPFIPEAAQKMRRALNLDPAEKSWQYATLPAGKQLGELVHLFEKINRQTLPAD